jgi:hypothetical protein
MHRHRSQVAPKSQDIKQYVGFYPSNLGQSWSIHWPACADFFRGATLHATALESARSFSANLIINLSFVCGARILIQDPPEVAELGYASAKVLHCEAQ